MIPGQPEWGPKVPYAAAEGPCLPLRAACSDEP